MNSKDNKKPATTVAFSVHPAILESVVSSQSGTLHKALLELLMNSCDANATRIDVTVNADTFSVKDDGEGFTDSEQVLTCFGQFGTPQTEQKTYGRFRIGRGQCFTWGIVTWRSGTFEMVVDMLGKGLQYDFHEDKVTVHGCTVTGQLYEVMTSLDVYNTCTKLADLVKYVNTPIYINGKQANKIPSGEKWDYESDDAYILFDRYRYNGLHVYNQGVYSASFPQDAYGVNGLVVSKVPLTVNFARNDIILNKCEVWKRLSRFIKTCGTEKILKQKQLSDPEQRNIISRWLSGEFTYQQICECPILTDIADRRFSIKTFLKEKKISISLRDKSLLADRVQSSGMARVLSVNTIYKFDCHSLGSFASRLADLMKMENELVLLDEIDFVEDIDSFAKHFNGGFFVYEDNKLTSLELSALMAIRNGDKYVRAALCRSGALQFEPLERTIIAGASDGIDAWTDGTSNIFIHRRWLKKAKYGIEWFFHACQLLAHEYLHYESDQDSHPHDAVFHAAYHDISLFVAQQKNDTDLHTAARKMAAKFAALRTKADGNTPKAFYQFGGSVSSTMHDIVHNNWRKTSAELHKLKRTGPHVEDPERLVFWRGNYAGVSFRGVMTLAGPYLYIEDRENYFNESMSVGKTKRAYRSTSLDALDVVECRQLSEEIGSGIYFHDITDDSGYIPLQHPSCRDFYGSPACRKFLRTWIEREPTLADLCKQAPDHTKDWYLAATRLEPPEMGDEELSWKISGSSEFD